jgi:hypothetical protein
MLETAIEPVGHQLEKLKLVETPTSKGSRDLVPVAVKHVQAAFGGVLRVLFGSDYVLLVLSSDFALAGHCSSAWLGPEQCPELVITVPVTHQQILTHNCDSLAP